MQKNSFLRLRELSLSRDYSAMVIIASIAIMLVIIFSSYINYNSYLRKQNNILVNSAAKIQQSLTKSFDYSAHLLRFFSEKIIHSPITDPADINRLLRTEFAVDAMLKQLFSWTLFDWIDENNRLITFSPFSQTPKSVDISSREYIKSTRTFPGILHFSKPDIGRPSGEWIIPAAFGVVDKNGRYCGAIGMGFNINDLRTHIDKELNSYDFDYIILDSQQQIIFTSYNYDISEQSIGKALPSIVFTSRDSGFLHSKVRYDNASFYYYNKIPNTPFTILMGYKTKLFKQELSDIIISSSATTMIMGGALILFLILLRQLLISPIVNLSNIAEDIVKTDGRNQVQFEDHHIKEFNILAKQLANLIHFINKLKLTEEELQTSKAELETAYNSIKSMNSILENKIQERTKELIEALAAKTNFLNNMSHEIRTPIQGFTNISEGLVQHWKEFNEAKRFELARQVAVNSKRLSNLLGNLLDLSKFNGDKMLLNLKKVDITILTEQIIEECKTLYLHNDRKISFEVVSSYNTLIEIDEERIEQVLRNLYVNAIKFSPDNGKLIAHIVPASVSYAELGAVAGVHFELIDEGIGIPEKELKSVFQPFIQSSRTRTKAGGTGLGLAICSKIILTHHGRIWAQNNPTAGASFNFILPVSQEGLSTSNDHSEPSTEDPVICNISKNSLTILVIDDEESCILSLELLLYGLQYKIIKASSGMSGLTILQERFDEINIVMLDLMMPDTHGLQVLQAIKEDPNLKHIPIILQTGTSNEEEIKVAYELGICCYVKKPYQKNDILDAIQKAELTVTK